MLAASSSTLILLISTLNRNLRARLLILLPIHYYTLYIVPQLSL